MTAQRIQGLRSSAERLSISEGAPDVELPLPRLLSTIFTQHPPQAARRDALLQARHRRRAASACACYLGARAYF
jgi:hypothetical protein